MATRIEGVAEELRRRIDSGSLKPGSRAPSIRRAAADFGVSKNTIIEAYDRLVTSGFLASRHGSGFFAAKPQVHSQPIRPPHVEEAVDIVTLLRAQLEETFSVRVGDGRPPPSWTEEAQGRRQPTPGAARGISSEDGYGSAMGAPELRDRIARTHGSA